MLRKIISLILIQISVIAIFSCGGSDSSGSKSKITKLNIVTGNTAFVKSANNLAQVAPGGSSVKSVYKSTSSTDELNDVTTEDGDTVTVSSAIQVNDKYVLLQNLTTTDGETTEDDYILDVVTGETTALSIWPDNSKRVAASMDNLYAYYVSGGALYEVSLATGDTTLISDTTNYYAYNPAGGYKITTGSWSGSRLVFRDNSNHLYIFGIDSINNAVPQGQAARFSLNDGVWSEDTTFNESYFAQMPGSIADQIPGSSLTMTKWLISDQTTGMMYQIYADKTTVTISLYNVDTWQTGSQVYSATLSEPISGTTFLGSNNTFQQSMIATGWMILKYASDGGNITLTEINVPDEIPSTSTIILNNNYEICYGPGAVTNWSYLDGVLYILDPVTSDVYQWDMVSTFTATSLTVGSNITFLF